MVKRIRHAFLTLILHVKSFPCRCAAMASSKQGKSVTPVRVTIQHVVIHRLANSGPEPCVTQAVRPVAQAIATLRQQRSYAGSRGMIGVIHPSFALATHQRVQRISLNQTVRASCPFNQDRSHISSRPRLWDRGVGLCRWHLHVIGLYVYFVPWEITLAKY